MNSGLPVNYKLEQNVGWEQFKVNNEFDDSYNRLNINKIEFESDIFITYRQGGQDLTVDMERKRRAVLEVNRRGHHAYPGIRPGDGYLFTIYNDDLGSAQLGTKPVRLVTANENYLVFRGYEVLAMGPFGLIDPGNTDYGVAIFLDGKRIRKVAFYRYDTNKSYEYAHTYKYCELRSVPKIGSGLAQIEEEDDYLDIDYDRVKRNADAFSRRFALMTMSEKTNLARETDRLFNVGIRYWNNDQRPTALKYFAQALKVFPINTDVIGLYGDYYEYSDYDLSMKFYLLAISLNSIRKKDFYQLANFYKWKGQYDNANKCYELYELAKLRAGIVNDD